MLLPAIEPLLAARDEIRTQMRKLNNALERASRADPICKLFQTIPGVGPLTALAFKATIGDPSRFKRSKLVPAHLGLTLRMFNRERPTGQGMSPNPATSSCVICWLKPRHR